VKNILSIAIIVLWAVTGNSDSKDNLRLNQIQVIGSHNSYKQAIDPALFKEYQRTDSASASHIDYEHINITDQLDMGLLNLEIDVYADKEGGRYAHPKGLDWAKGQPPYDPEGKMYKPGFKIFHILDLDFRSHYLTLTDCLKDLKKWSIAHPGHYPIFITMEAKDEPRKKPGSTLPEKFTSDTFDELDRVLLANLGKERILTPDMVRKDFVTLNEAVLKNKWPTLKEAKGKFVFILDDKKAKRSMYMAGHPSLKGRVLFADADAGTPEAAIMIRNDAKKDPIQQLVKQGYIIRTRADADTKQARKNDKSAFAAACSSGAQIITTDFYLKSTHFLSNYSVSFEGGKFFRPNPVSAGE
jgi:hypothetical protein